MAVCRDYGNSRLHPLLDWRLAVDITRLLRDGREFDPMIWIDHTFDIADGFEAGLPGWELTDIAGRPALTNAPGQQVCLITHPLETTSEVGRGPDLSRAVARAESSWADVRMQSWFNLLRSPGAAILEIPESD